LKAGNRRRALVASLAFGLAVAKGASAEDAGDFRRAVTDWLAMPTGDERDAARKKLDDAFAAAPVRDLEAAVRKGLTLRATTATEALRKGEHEDRLTLVDGFVFRALGREVTYAVGLPPSYDPAKRYPLVFDPGHGAMKTREERLRDGQTGVYLRALDGKNAIFVRTNFLSAMPSDDAYEALHREKGDGWFASVFEACVRDVATRFSVDPDRIYVVGVSQTGFFAWQLAVRSPWRYAGACPGMAVLNSARSTLPNCVGLPIYVLTGEKDTIVPPEQGRWAASTLRRLGSDVEYDEVKGGDHGAWIQRGPAGIRWLLEKKRGPLPKHCAAAVVGPLPFQGAFLRVDEVEPAPKGAPASRPDALVEASIDGRTVKVTSDDVKRLTLFLSDALVDLDQPIVVEWNGKKVHDGPLPRRLDVLVETLDERVDVARPFTAKLELR
jgi:poly(3-hydroxybutyrate) depolymerase